MADNITLDPGVGGAVCKTDDDGVAHWQYVKNAFGPDNTQTRVTTTEGLPVQNDDTSLEVEGEAAEDAAVSGNPVLTGGRYDVAPRTLDDGDVGAIALDADGAVHVSDGGNALTVDGTITEANSAAIKTAVEIIDDWDESDRAKVNPIVGQAGVAAGAGAVGVTVPRVTLASDDPAVAKLGTIDADTGAIKTAVEILDNAIAGNEMQVDIVAALPTGANVIGKLAANSGVDIGDTDVTSVVPGTAATNLGKAEDAAHLSGDVGVMTLGVRKDAANGASGADGDYVPLTTDADGLLRVLPGVKGTVNYANINGIVSGNNTLVAAAGVGNKIRVLSMLLVAHGNVTVIIEDGAAGADLSGPYEFDGDNQPKGISLDFSPVGHFVTSANTLLNMSLDAAVRVAGHIVYDVVT